MSSTAVRLDPITFQVIVSRLSGIVQEMQENIFRTGYSTIVRESHDASCMMMDAQGDVVGEHVVAALHVTALPGVVRAVRRSFGDDIHPGDAFLTNHPYLADVTHSVDTAIVAPVFVGDRLVAFCGSIGHQSDLGGMVPGTGNGSAREIFQEGTLFPVVRYMEGGKVARDIEAVLRANSRTPYLVIGDISGQIGCARLGERRLLETIERYGLETVLAVFAEKQDRTERRVRAALAAIPDGDAEAELAIDAAGGAGSAIRFHLRVEKRGERILFDFTKSSDQVEMPINVRPSNVRGCIYYALIGLIDPTIENNGGLARSIELKVRPGSILDPVFPAPTNTYMNTTMAVVELVCAAMSKLSPEKQVAGVGGVGGGLAIGGRYPDGRLFSTYELVGTAYGASNENDGASGISTLLNNAHTAPIEIMENEFPIRLRRFELIRDSGGAGRFRGGLAPVREYDVLVEQAQLTLRGGKHEVPAQGVAGGAPGRLGNCIINPGSSEEKSLPSRISGVPLKRGDVVRLEKAAGGGLGPPKERPFERVLDDVIDGYVSREAAIAVYGVDAARLDAALERFA